MYDREILFLEILETSRAKEQIF